MSLETELKSLQADNERLQAEITAKDNLYAANVKQNKALWDYTYELCRSHQILKSLVDKLIINASPWRKALLGLILSSRTMKEIQKEISVSQYQDAVASQYKDLIQ